MQRRGFERHAHARQAAGSTVEVHEADAMPALDMPVAE